MRKVIIPELFSPVKIENGGLVNKGGNPVKYFPVDNYPIINSTRDFPSPVNEDGTVRLPTLEEME